MPVTRGLGFLGRTSERQRLDGMLAHARDGQSAVLVIRGPPGIGKTALLRYAARQASGLRIAEVDGVQAEMELPFAGIHRLCGPMCDRLDVLAPPQRNALSVALGLSPGEPPGRFLIGLAVLSLLCAVAEERPLLCLLDDAQWLDAASGQVLACVARRLLAESVAMVFALREPSAGHAFDGLSQLPLEGLDEADARALLSTAVPGRLDDHVRDRIVAETRGNPLALVELSQKMTAPERAGGYVQPAARDLPRSAGSGILAARGGAAGGHAATDPSRGGRSTRGRDAVVAGCRNTRDRRERDGTGKPEGAPGGERPGGVA